jgi:hypothetical protein
MSHVILLTDAHEAPAYELIEALRGAGVKTLIEGLREVEVEVALAKQQKREGVRDAEGPPPLAVLYEVVPGADMVELHTAIDHAKAFWPGAPLVACRRQTNGYQSHNLRLPTSRHNFRRCFARLKVMAIRVSCDFRN